MQSFFSLYIKDREDVIHPEKQPALWRSLLCYKDNKPAINLQYHC